MTPHMLFLSAPLRIARIDPTDNKNMTVLNSTQVTTQGFDSAIMNDIIPSWTVPVITKSIYHVMFGGGIDFDNMGIIPKYKWKPTDSGVIFRFNNTKTREVYDSNIYYGGKIAKSMTSESKNIGLSQERSAK